MHTLFRVYFTYIQRSNIIDKDVSKKTQDMYKKYALINDKLG